MKAQASLRIRAVSPEPLLFVHMKYGKIRHLAPLDGSEEASEKEVTIKLNWWLRRLI